MIRLHLVSVALLGGCAAKAPAPVTPAPDDPRVAVTDWAQVTRLNCHTDGSGQPVACSSDADCAGGARCDASAGCGCCVDAPPEVAADQPLSRAMFSGCEAGACAPPRFCTASADAAGACTMSFDGSIWVWATTPLDAGARLEDVRRDLCIKVEDGQECMWRLELPSGGYQLDAPVPVHYEGSYECGGRTCNGAPALRVAPAAGTYPVTLAVDGCS